MLKEAGTNEYFEELLALARTAKARGYWPHERPIAADVLDTFAGLLGAIASADGDVSASEMDLLGDVVFSSTGEAPAPDGLRTLVANGLKAAWAELSNPDDRGAVWELRGGLLARQLSAAPDFLSAFVAHDRERGGTLAARAVDLLELSGFEMIMVDGECEGRETETLGQYIGGLRMHLLDAGVEVTVGRLGFP